MTENRNEKYLSSLLYWSYLIFFVSLICSFRVVSSIAIALILVFGLAKNKINTGKYLNREIPAIFITGCIIFYVLQFIALLYTDNLSSGQRHVELKSSLIFIPVAVGCCDYLNNTVRKKLMPGYIVILLLTTIYCLVFSFITYYKTGDISAIFYHRLVSPFAQHAIQFSILVFIGLVYLLESIRQSHHRKKLAITLSIVVYFIIFLLLLSSKLIIAFCFIYLIYYFLISHKKLTSKRFVVPLLVSGGLTMAALVLLTPNPISKRFNEIISGNITLIYEEKFNPGIYFNGLQFRLLQGRFVSEILNENHAWLLGLSPGDAQQALDQKYISTDMYIGQPSGEDHGFLGYNTHNQFLESILQTGIVGLAAFIMIFFGIIKMAVQRKRNELSSVVILLLIYALNESVFETQYGLMIFLFFPLFLYKNDPEGR